MARIDSLTVDVSARITVSNEMAERCLRMLEWWQDDHADACIIGERQPDGRTVFRIVNRAEPKRDGGDGDD